MKEPHLDEDMYLQERYGEDEAETKDCYTCKHWNNIECLMGGDYYCNENYDKWESKNEYF